jgi:DNA (cytosine-5)-methyltransferase 3A
MNMKSESGINVLSLFDGMSCGQIALQNCGIVVSNYFASEIDKHAIKVTQHNFPNTKQLGNVTKVYGKDLPKIDLLIGGSPCQSFSFAGKRKGMSTKCETEILTLEHYLKLKAEGYEFEGQSYLFWEYMRLLNEVKPKYFLLENVMMGEKWEKILSKAIGVNGIHINSALISAQNRKRIYWTNIGMRPGGLFGDLESIIPQPKDKGILLKDILETDVAKKYFLSEKTLKTIGDYAKDYVITGKSPCLTTELAHGTGRDFTPRIAKEIAHCVATRGREDTAVLTPKRTEYGKAIRKDYEAGNIETQRKNIHQLEPRTDGKTNTLTSVQKDNLVMQLNPSKESGGQQPYQQNRVYDTEGISPALCANKADLLIKENTLIDFSHQNEGLRYYEGKAPTLNQRDYKEPRCIFKNSSIRRLTPTECERLQTVKDNYTAHVSDTQRYRMLGNGWTVDVIAHIFSYMDLTAKSPGEVGGDE